MKCEYLMTPLDEQEIKTCQIVNPGKTELGWILDLSADSRVEVFYISNDKNVKSLPDNIGLKFSTVKAIEISFCSLKSLEPRQFQNLTKLHLLVLSHNSIGEIKSGTFDELSNLRDLSLASNFLKTLDENIFVNNHNLANIWLEKNQIEILSPKILEGKEKLIYVDLRENRCADDFYYSHNFSLLRSNLLEKCANANLKTTV